MADGVNRKTVLVVAALSFFLATFMGSSLNIALPTIGQELSMDAVSLGWVATAYILASASLLLPFGRLADIYGRKRILTIGLSIYTLATILLAFVPSGAALIALRAFQGSGGAMVFSTGVALVTSVFPEGERGKALGITTAMAYLGLSLGPVIGGLLTEHFGWRSIFLATVPLGVAALVLIKKRIKGEWAEAKGEGFNRTGALIYGFSLTAIIYGFSRLPEALGIGLVVGGVAGIGAFIRQEMRVAHPLLDISLFRNNRIFAFSNLAVLLNYSAAFAVSFLMSLYLQYIKGLSPDVAGLVLVAMPAVQAAFSPAAGRLSDRVDPRVLSSVGMALIAVGLFIFISLGEATTLRSIIGNLVMLGFGFALFAAPNTNAIMSAVSEKYFGVASATLATMRQVGMMLSIGIAMLLFATNIGRIEITPAYYPLFLRSLKTAFTIFTILCVAGIFASLARGKSERPSEPD